MPEGKKKTCSRDYQEIPAGTVFLLADFAMKGAYSVSRIRFEWYSIESLRGLNRRLHIGQTDGLPYSKYASHKGWASFGYPDRPLMPGRYRLIVTASHSKSAPVVKDFEVSENRYRWKRRFSSE